MATDVFDLYGRVRLDTSEYNKELNSAGSAFDGLGDKIKSGLGAITAATGAALTAGAAAVGKVVSDAVGAYGEYEQLVGGVETLFGDSAAEVLANSEKAFQTAGMSVNEYMETSIQSAAALINSLGDDTSQAAELMDMSIRDMSDNVNKMGTSMESIQNAYRGFSRGNFTMLDNLSLGFSGTKEGMQELLDKAQQISGIKYDISSYSDIVKAIHVVQQEMGITGTTAAEAADTIQGSTGSMKAAWENLKVELVKEDGDISKSLDILVNSALTVFDNLEPKIERALGGVSQFVDKAAPIIAEKLPPIIEKIVPPLLSASGTLVYSVGKGIAQALPSLARSVGNLATGLYNDFTQADLGAFDWIRQDAIKVVDSVKETLGKIDLSRLIESVGDYGDSLNTYWEKIGEGFTWFVDNVASPVIEWTANDILPVFFEGLAGAVDVLTSALDFLKTPALAVWEGFLQPLGEIVGGTIEGTLMLISDGLNAIGDAVEGVDWEGFWVDMFSGDFGEDWSVGWQELKDTIGECAGAIDDFFNTSEFGESWNNFWQGVGATVYDIQKDYIEPFIDDVTTGWDMIGTGISNAVQFFTDFRDAVVAGWDMIGDAIDNFVEAHREGMQMIKEFLGLDEGTFSSTESPTFGEGISRGIRAQAQGGIIRKPTVTLSGEAGDEANIPLYNDNLGIKQIADAITRNMATASNVINITVNGGNGDPETIAEIIKDKIDTLLNENRVAASRAIGGVAW